MISETVITEPLLSPFEHDFTMLGGLKGNVMVKVTDARGVDCPADWTAVMEPEDKVTWTVRVVLRPEWAYPVKVKVMVDWAERPVGSEETSA